MSKGMQARLQHHGDSMSVIDQQYFHWLLPREGTLAEIGRLPCNKV
jgi:hypothetical protein